MSLCPPCKSITAATYASGVNVDVAASKDDVKPQRTVVLSYPKNSPMFCVPCWITIPPSPVVFDPDANNTNLSATNKFSVFWNDAVPCTVTLP